LGDRLDCEGTFKLKPDGQRPVIFPGVDRLPLASVFCSQGFLFPELMSVLGQGGHGCYERGRVYRLGNVALEAGLETFSTVRIGI
jgi:hypothetical protein